MDSKRACSKQRSTGNEQPTSARGMMGSWELGTHGSQLSCQAVTRILCWLNKGKRSPQTWMGKGQPSLFNDSARVQCCKKIVLRGFSLHLDLAESFLWTLHFPPFKWHLESRFHSAGDRQFLQNALLLYRGKRLHGNIFHWILKSIFSWFIVRLGRVVWERKKKPLGISILTND